jgi:transposase InsO family protein
MSAEYSIHELCAAFGVTHTGYHAWARRKPGLRAQANAALLPLITQAHQESRQTYGSPRIRNWLLQHGHRCGRGRVARLMKQAGLTRRWRRRFRPVSLTDSNHDLPVAANRLSHQVPTLQPDAVWVADITYIKTDESVSLC